MGSDETTLKPVASVWSRSSGVPQFDCEPNDIIDTLLERRWGIKAPGYTVDALNCYVMDGQDALRAIYGLKACHDYNIAVDVAQHCVCIFIDIEKSECCDVFSCIKASRKKVKETLDKSSDGARLVAKLLPSAGDPLEEGFERMCFGFRTVRIGPVAVLYELGEHLELIGERVFRELEKIGVASQVTLPLEIANNILAVVTTPDIRDGFASRCTPNPLQTAADKAYKIEFEEARFRSELELNVMSWP
ncbi:hypothetical protein BDV26DRAFT_297236 [Aspergillus bertholletiae]|uniref:Uncharacterized protein n=1 Tax=Aspergillus bertholletiae TaxID=1226010 RepID=A0A5N7AWD7_9EURO|nr:hypothetical protein BDV26DRAFT_297236 [Aspergillus bertholletiae]